MLTPRLSVQSRHRVCPKYKAYNREHTTSIECCEKESATPHGTEMRHTPTMNTSRQRATRAIFGGHTERRSGQQVRARAAQGGKEKEKDRMTCSDYHRNEEWVAARDGAPVLLCCRRFPGEHDPSVTCKKREGPNTQ